MATESSISKILHVDMNAFFASCEEARNPDLRGKPIIVGSDEVRSVVSAASYEARKYGIHSAMPIFRAKELCPDAIFVPVDMNYYVKVSHQVHQIFQKYAYRVESAGLDEAFIDAGPALNIYGTPEKIAALIISEVLSETGLKCTIGIGRTKSVAKLASGLAKPAKKDGSSTGYESSKEGYLVIAPDETEDFLKSLLVRDLYGVGPKTSAKLLSHGIVTVPDLLETPHTSLVGLLGKTTSDKLLTLAKGEDYVEVKSKQPEAKSVGREITLREDTRSLFTLKKVLHSLADEVSLTLRLTKTVARTITLVLKTSDRVRHTRSKSFEMPTNSSYEIRCEINAQLLLFLKEDPRDIRLIGLSTSQFVPEISGYSSDSLLDYIDGSVSYLRKIKTVEKVLDNVV